MGLAHAYAAAKRGKRVVLFERNAAAQGASMRNFGMIWPIGQPHGEMHAMALRSQQLWVEVLEQTRLPYFETGSLHVVYRDDEAEVAREFSEIGPALGYDCQWLCPREVLDRSAAVKPDGLRGALWSPTELTVDPRRTIPVLPSFLAAQLGVELRFGCIETCAETWMAECAIVCTGDDFETLYADLFACSGLTRVKLQMLRTRPQPEGWRLGPALAAGLTLRFYRAFEVCVSLAALKRRIAAETPEYDAWGIHGLVSQTADGELTLGDSHEYGRSVDVFNKEEIDTLMLGYLNTFLQAPTLEISQRWHGVYCKHPEKSYLSIGPAEGVRIVTGVGGSGMTLSFGLAEQTMRELSL